MITKSNNILQRRDIMFYDKFERLCRENGYTPSGACVAMGRSRNLAAKWKSTGTSPSMAVLREIAQFFDVPVDELVSEDDDIKARQEMFDNADMRILFDAARGIPRSKLYETIAMLNKYKEDNNIDT